MPIDPVVFQTAPLLRGKALEAGRRQRFTFRAGSAPAGTAAELTIAGQGWFETSESVKADSSLNGRIALVTGGAQGFGEEITRGLVAQGSFVVIA